MADLPRWAPAHWPTIPTAAGMTLGRAGAATPGPGWITHAHAATTRADAP